MEQPWKEAVLKERTADFLLVHVLKELADPLLEERIGLLLDVYLKVEFALQLLLKLLELSIGLFLVLLCL